MEEKENILHTLNPLQLIGVLRDRGHQLPFAKRQNDVRNVHCTQSAHSIQTKLVKTRRKFQPSTQTRSGFNACITNRFLSLQMSVCAAKQLLQPSLQKGCDASNQASPSKISQQFTIANPSELLQGPKCSHTLLKYF